MNEQARFFLAMRAALIRSAPTIPEDLRAALLAQARRSNPSWSRRLRAALMTPWGLGAGLAFAAAALALALRFSMRPQILSCADRNALSMRSRAP